MGNCVFCDPDKLAQSAKLENSEYFTLRLDPNPVNFGHILIIPNQHVENIDGLTPEEMKKLKNRISDAKEKVEEHKDVKDQYFEILKKGNEKSEEMIKSVIGEKRSPNGFNIGINEGEAAGQTIDHLHVHIIPRYEEDVENPEGGVRTVIPDRADYT